MDWFLIRDNDHLGPFTEEVLHQLFKSGELDADTLVWKEGWESSQSYQEVFLAGAEKDQQEIEVINEATEEYFEEVVCSEEPAVEPEVVEDILPQIPNEPESFEEVIEGKPEENVTRDDDLPPDLPPDLPSELTLAPPPEQPKVVSKKKKKPIKRTKAIDESETEVQLEDVFDLETDVIKQEKKIQKLIRHTVIAGIVLIIGLPILYYFLQTDDVFSRPSTMSLEDYERLSKVAMIDSRDSHFAFSLATDKRTLWISTNIPLEGEVFINLKSLNHRVLGDTRVEVKSRGELEKHLITLKEFQFVQGTKFLDGYYDAEIYTVKDLEQPLINRLFEQREKQFRYLDNVLITSLHHAEFKKALAREQAKKNSNERRFWEDLIEEYRTIKGITESIRQSLEATFESPKEEWLQSVSEFERVYKSNYGIFFTSFVQSIEAKYEKIAQQNFKDKIRVLSEYKKLTELAREIGEESMSVLENLKSTNVRELTPEKYQEFKYETLLKINLIITQCEKKIEEL
ncbi:MAG: hypothetical protein CME62_17495 [Halobacteriovoraceae bacterium]|nr:hypothetical protein [Halobacteriovoraceae bacterium]|tara:strand:+ start:40948 stop:42489 length:1542 start_codon:yes stop_codon:yes gene_type:complete